MSATQATDYRKRTYAKRTNSVCGPQPISPPTPQFQPLMAASSKNLMSDAGAGRVLKGWKRGQSCTSNALWVHKARIFAFRKEALRNLVARRILSRNRSCFSCIMCPSEHEGRESQAGHADSLNRLDGKGMRTKPVPADDFEHYVFPKKKSGRVLGDWCLVGWWSTDW